MILHDAPGGDHGCAEMLIGVSEPATRPPRGRGARRGCELSCTLPPTPTHVPHNCCEYLRETPPSLSSGQELLKTNVICGIFLYCKKFPFQSNSCHYIFCLNEHAFTFSSGLCFFLSLLFVYLLYKSAMKVSDKDGPVLSYFQV